MNMTDLIDSITVTNGNSIKDTIVTAIACIPFIPGGIVMLFRYLGKIKIEINRYYNFKNHAQRVKDTHGIEIFRKKIWGLI
jgi:hypothetical protein